MWDWGRNGRRGGTVEEEEKRGKNDRRDKWWREWGRKSRRGGVGVGQERWEGRVVEEEEKRGRGGIVGGEEW